MSILTLESLGSLKKVCVPIKAKYPKEIIRLAKKAKKSGAGYLEIWLDQVKKDDLERLLKKIPKPYIAVCKDKWENGSFRGGNKEKIQKLLLSASYGAEFIDINIETDFRLLKSAIFTLKYLKKRSESGEKPKIILSHHNFSKTPALEELLQISDKAFKLGADIMKIATFVKRPSDNVILFELIARLQDQKKQAIVIGMGRNGVISRVGCMLIGGFLTYAAIDKKKRTAEGQLILE